MQGDSIRVMLLVTDALEKMGIRYAVGGSLSSSVHGIMRSTLDVDIVADMRLEHVSRLIGALSSEFYTDDEMIKEAIKTQSSFNLIHYDTATKVDIFIPKDRNFDRLQLERRIATVVVEEPEFRVYVTSPEDIILSKLEWYRMGGEISDRQWQDVMNVVKTKSGQLDLTYLHRLAKELAVEDLLERILEEV